MKQQLIAQKDFALLAGVSGAAISKASREGQPLGPCKVGRRIDAAHPLAREYVAKRKLASPVNGHQDPLYPQVLDFCMDLGKFTQKEISTRFGVGLPRSRRLIEAFRVDGLLPVVPVAAPKPPPVAAPKPPPVVVVAAPKPPPPPLQRQPGNQSTAPRGTDAAKRARIAATPADEEIHEIPEFIMPFADMTLRQIIDKFGTAERFNDFLNALRRIEEIHERRLKSAMKEGELVSRELVQKQFVDVFNTAHLRLLTDGAKTLSVGVVSKHLSGASEAEIELYVADIIGSFIRPVKKQIARSLRATDG